MMIFNHHRLRIRARHHHSQIMKNLSLNLTKMRIIKKKSKIILMGKKILLLIFQKNLFLILNHAW